MKQVQVQDNPYMAEERRLCLSTSSSRGPKTRVNLSSHTGLKMQLHLIHPPAPTRAVMSDSSDDDGIVNTFLDRP